jgi:hypothetical protein
MAVQKSARWSQLVEKHGLLWAGLYHLGLVREPLDTLTEREKPLPGVAKLLIYVISIAAVLVTGSAEVIAIGQGITAHDFVRVIVAAMMLGVLLVMVYAMDSAVARTLPRISILHQRREYLTLFECIAYCLTVCGIEVTTLYILILNENNVSEVLRGRPLIAPSLYAVMALLRAVMTVWTLYHSHIVNEALPIQLSTAKREGAELFGGQLMLMIRSVRDMHGIRAGKIMQNFLLFLQPEPKAPRTGPAQAGQKRYSRRLEQLALDKAHRDELVLALDELFPHGLPGKDVGLQVAPVIAASAPVASPQVVPEVSDQVAGDEEGPDEEDSPPQGRYNWRRINERLQASQAVNQ